jgi:electron transfer flavoprotein alpha subunit
MENINGPVWVIAEQIDCRILPVSFQLVGRARQLADELQTSVEAVLLGDRIEEQARLLIAGGADSVYLGNDPQLQLYQPEIYTEMIVQLAGQRQPEIVLFGSTSMGRELAPLVAARLKTGLTAHCIDLTLDKNRILQQHIPAYGGLLSICCPLKRPQMATVAQGVFPQPEPDEKRAGELIALELPTGLPGHTRTLGVAREASDGMPLESAPIVVAGGAGAGDRQGWKQIADLAQSLKAALGCTRPVVDEGWSELKNMIGQSGKMISPNLYIGVGLSGEQQHMVGITNAKIMVAINNDAKSPVFDQVDYGIVEDCREFIPILIEKIKEYYEKQVTC